MKDSTHRKKAVKIPSRKNPAKVPPGVRLSEDLAGIDYALPGTLTRRYMRCGKPKCRCKANPPVLHGPYFHWTRTVAGKTVTKTLTEEQATRYQVWFDNARRLREAITELEATSLHALEDTEDREPENRDN